MEQNSAAGQGKSQACAASFSGACLVYPVETFKNLILQFIRNTHSAVLDFDIEKFMVRI